jgi:predicted extracellular nuclease
MLTTITSPMYLTEYFQLDNFGEVRVSSGGVLHTPTDVAEPGEEARAVAAENARRTLLIDDGSSRSNPSPVPFGATATDPIRRGDLATGLEGILHFDRGVFRLQPTGTVGFAERNPRRPAPTVAGDIRIASFNVLNYFTTLGSRGAPTAAEFEQQEAKVVAAISGLGADVVALQEIESKPDATDPTRNQPSETLVAALNERDGAGIWAATRIPGNFTGTDVITTAIIYRTDRVRAVGEPLALADDAFDNARQPIAQTFESGGERFTVVANHFKSKSCGSGAGAATGANADTGDGQGCWNADRVEQAKALAGFVATLADRSDDDDVLVLGDLNAYTKEDPLDVLRASGLLDQRRDLPREEAYSYVFDGGQGVLDHALATPSWDARRTGAAAWHLNADEPGRLRVRRRGRALHAGAVPVLRPRPAAARLCPGHGADVLRSAGHHRRHRRRRPSDRHERARRDRRAAEAMTSSWPPPATTWSAAGRRRPALRQQRQGPSRRRDGRRRDPGRQRRRPARSAARAPTGSRAATATIASRRRRHGARGRGDTSSRGEARRSSLRP